MVESYDPADHEAPAVIGHPSANHPAYGWVEGLKREGTKLMAKFKQVVPEFSEMVGKGLFKKRSIRVLADGRLGHVGFLGAVPPAVKGLKDIEFEDDEEGFDYDFNECEKKEAGMKTAEELQRELDEEKKRRVAAETQAAEFKAANEQAAADFAESQKKAREKEILDFIEAGIKEGKLLPAWKEKGIAEFMNALDGQEGEYEFAEGKKETPLGWFKGFIADFSAHPLFKDMARLEKEDEKKAADFAEDEKLAEEIAAYTGVATK
jgi:hypothetical protein